VYVTKTTTKEIFQEVYEFTLVLEYHNVKKINIFKNLKMEKELETIEERFKKLYSKQYKINIYYSMISKTRNGGMDCLKRKIDEKRIPVRVPVKKEVYESFDSIIPEILKKERRMILAKKYREEKYSVKPKTWKW
jgi:hypothetical protein